MRPELSTFDMIPQAGPEMWVRRIKANESFVFVIVGDNWWGVVTHWNPSAKRSSPHLRDKKLCNGCRSGYPMRRKLYLHVYNEKEHKQEIIELTPLMAQQLEDQIGTPKNWRGHRFSVKRGRGDKARCNLTLLPHFDQFGKGPLQIPARDPEATLLELWGFNAGVQLGDDPADGVVPISRAI